ncbi:hypothetical protein [Siminovitchia terrae]|uniref:hypothetical protein n=1 Tax=Siminovitchia terrae TaxID=1914933 RepID=UPI00163CA1BF|nr:hypothetical protein [Siminovitchia terrae]
MNMDDWERALRMTAWTTASIGAVVATIKNLSDLNDKKKKKRRSPGKKKRRK